MGESELGMFIYQYDTPMCEEAIERLRKTGLFEDEDLDSLGGRFCYEIARPAVLGWGMVPHDVYWSPNKASCLVGYTGSYIQHLCKTEQVSYWWHSGGYLISVDEIIKLRKRYLARHNK